MVNILSAFNFLELSNMKQANQAQTKLDDLKEKAAYLQQQGVPVKSWREFGQEVKQETPPYGRNIAVGAGAGAVILGAFSFKTATSPRFPISERT